MDEIMTKLINLTKTEFINNRKLRNVRKFGSQAMSYSTLQDGIKEFRHPLFKGYIAYTTVWGVDYVLSDPITPKEDQIKATMLFLEQRKNVVFCQISKEYAMLLTYFKCQISGFGVENIIDLKSFEVKWKKRKCLKSYLSKLGKEGFYVFECRPEINKVWAINEQWLKAKSNDRELKFMARPFEHHDEPDVRNFYLFKANEIVGFCSFDPIYANDESQEIVSYTLQHLRVSNTAPLGSQDFLILKALDEFKQQGIARVSLGLAPLYKRDNGGFKGSKLADAIFGLIYKTNLFYNYETIGKHKDHYKAHQEQTFVATNHKFTLRKLCGILKVNNLI